MADITTGTYIPIVTSVENHNRGTTINEVYVKMNNPAVLNLCTLGWGPQTLLGEGGHHS